jgi:methylmalonyl-CoA epimerase
MLKIDHVAIAVKELSAVVDFWNQTLGLGEPHFEVVDEQKVRIAMFQTGESRIELLEPISNDSPISKFLEKRGAGIHHIALRVKDIESALEQLKSSGIRLIDESPKIGAEGSKIAFIHPGSTGGVLLELVEPKEK